MARHLSFCSKFRASGPPQDPTVHLIRAMRRLLSRSLESSKCLRLVFFCYVYGECFPIIL
ncbi:hypothetical protein PHJA_002531200 [Phtheirospermum japonicum]|uniref:Uncharacterized protein n=1 Tax=Phtheirospermum japonicum TaxID=374723 RepID=A0A830D6L9_9LAMI|nr:hypothetical protein PHJA_002531200 [Phtheirospermum japonicum]